MKKNNIGIIGVGIMGRGIVKNLQKNNIPLTLFSRDISKISDLESQNTVSYNSIEPLIDVCSHIIFCLTDDKVVLEYYNKIKDNFHGYILDFGTTSPELTQFMNFDFRGRGNIFLDSPMTGSKIASETGNIIYMVGYEKEEELENCKFIWDSTGKKVIPCKGVGNGQKVKICLNMVQAQILQSYMEGMVLSEKLGVPENIFLEVIENSAAKSGISDFKLNYIKEKNFIPNFSLKNMNKDLNHAIDLILEMNLSLPQAMSLKTIYSQGVTSNLGEEDFSSLIKINRANNFKK
jgi:3-hydroxyisobutyrate dehydrogenase